MASNRCIHHEERDAEFVCDVCGRYFCDECVGERYYPKPGYICHECSGVKPAEPAPKPVPAPQARKNLEPEPGEADSAATSRPIFAPPIEVAVVALCVLIILGVLAYYYFPREEVIELASNAPEDLAEFCISKITVLELSGSYPWLVELTAACPAPIEILETEFGHVVLSPDADRYGFTEIELERDPFAVMIME
jgi:hypothetical protein